MNYNFSTNSSAMPNALSICFSILLDNIALISPLKGFKITGSLIFLKIKSEYQIFSLIIKKILVVNYILMIVES